MGGGEVESSRVLVNIRPEHPAHGGVMLCTVQCRPASACARNSPPRGCTLKKQDKTRQETFMPCSEIILGEAIRK